MKPWSTLTRWGGAWQGWQGIKIGWGLALEWALGLNPPFRLCITSQGVDDTQPKGRQMGKHLVPAKFIHLFFLADPGHRLCFLPACRCAFAQCAC